MRFWDSSALVPLVVQQGSSSVAERWLSQDGELAIWTLAPVEIGSAVRRLVRSGEIQEEVATEAEALAAELGRLAHVVIDIERVKATAHRLLRVHPLRAADALQLGAALAWADGQPDGRTFHTFDRNLAVAAEREGFRLPSR